MTGLILIAAVAKNRVIGREGGLPWLIKEDMERFKALTIEHPVIMGMRTYESLPERFRPLPYRTNIVLTRRNIAGYEGVIFCGSLNEGIDEGRKKDEQIYVIGGESVYREALPIADRLEITEIQKDFEGDAFFPEIDRAIWRESHRENRAGKEFGYSFVSYERVREILEPQKT